MKKDAYAIRPTLLAAACGMLLAITVSAPAMARGDCDNVNETRVTPQSDGGTITTTVNGDCSVTVTRRDASGRIVSTKTVRPGIPPRRQP